MADRPYAPAAPTLRLYPALQQTVSDPRQLGRGDPDYPADDPQVSDDPPSTVRPAVAPDWRFGVFARLHTVDAPPAPDGTSSSVNGVAG